MYNLQGDLVEKKNYNLQLIIKLKYLFYETLFYPSTLGQMFNMNTEIASK